MPAILDHHGNPFQAERLTRRPEYVQRFASRLRAKYDAAQTTDENERHWANADLLDARSAMIPEIRRTVRARARYEAQENNSYAKGMVLTLANDLIGTGPRLQLMTSDKGANRRVERSFNRWSREIGLAAKLRTMRVSKAVDGEVFALCATNESLLHDVKLDVVPFEADFVDPPISEIDEESGIRVDRNGTPIEYHVYDTHPGSAAPTIERSQGTNLYRLGRFGYDGNWVPASDVIHWYRSDRPGQVRGISELVPSLPLFAMLRRFTIATIAAAETAADYAAVMRTGSGAIVEAETLGEDQWFDAIPMEYRAMLTLPSGWDITQLKAEHPTTTYAMFKREVINEVARCLNMPYNVGAADSSDYNYASGRLDHQVYHRSLAVDASQVECEILDRLFLKWLDEATLIPGLLPEGVGPFSQWPWSWFWDGAEHVDPAKVAASNEKNLRSGIANRPRIYAMSGADVDTEDEAAAASYGVPVEEYRQALFKSHFGGSTGVEAIHESKEESESEVA